MFHGCIQLWFHIEPNLSGNMFFWRFVNAYIFLYSWVLQKRISENMLYFVSDCSEGYSTGHYTQGSGIYLFHPNMAPGPFRVRCHMIIVGYTFIQKNEDGSTDFNWSWQEYKDGFGQLSKDSWLGNDKIAYIKNRCSQMLIFLTKDMSSSSGYTNRSPYPKTACTQWHIQTHWEAHTRKAWLWLFGLIERTALLYLRPW